MNNKAGLSSTHFGKLFDGNQHFLTQFHVLVYYNVDELLVLFLFAFLNLFNF